MAHLSHPLRFRQVHLDFHTSPHIPGIGKRFDAALWQETLKAAAVDSITLFAKCHHGWSYHPTGVGAIHPHLEFDLLRAQYEATKAAGINAPIYLSAGVDNRAAYEHPEWREVDKGGTYVGWARGVLQPGFHTMDFHSPYLDYLCDQIREVVRLFPDCDGIFLDIIHQTQSCGRWSLDFMRAHGLDPQKEEDRVESSRLAVEKYYQRTTAAARELRADMPIFHNVGHIARGRHDILPYYSHLELESLPTGGWGYDHFPMSAKYACHLPFDFLGMTGKFHMTWGEFGGYKHPNALRYECAAMLAFGARCSVGDQLHPAGELDSSTYRVIGEAYREVESKEPWCEGSRQVFDIGILSSEAESGDRSQAPPDEGACRVLLESHILFGVIDRTMAFEPFKALILPDTIRIDDSLKRKLDAYLLQGGKLILSGESGLWRDRDEFAFDLGADYGGLSECHPPDNVPCRGHDYILPVANLRAPFVDKPQIMYERSHRIKATRGASIGQVFDPYFNRTWEHFCSHGHTPSRDEPSGFDCGVQHGPILYFAHPVFRHYRAYGAVAAREFVVRSIRAFMGDALTLSTNLPSTARVSLTVQPSKGRHVLHFLYGPTVNRGGAVSLPGSSATTGAGVEVIEDLPSLHDVEVNLRMEAKRALLVPEGREICLTRGEGTITIRLEEFSCHQMIELS